MHGDQDDVDRGTPGGSLLRQYEQRRRTREQQVRARHPRLGGLLLALNDPPVTTTNFRRGAQAEVYVAAQLQRRCAPDVELLFNRRLSPRGRDGDIDVLAVTANGVHVVDVKHYQRARVRVRRRGGLVLPLREQLLINGRDRTHLLGSVERQREVVREVLDQFGVSVPLHVAMCFVDADLPMFSDRIKETALLGPRGVARRMNKPGPVSSDVRTALLRHLAGRLPAA
jgi:hypothetical protein